MTVAVVRPGSVTGVVPAPPSKSYTHRALVAAHLGQRRVDVVRPLVSDDTLRTVGAVRCLGSRVRLGRDHWTIEPAPVATRATIDCGESGTTLRLASALAALHPRTTRFVGGGRLPRRPLAPLLEALESLGASVERPNGDRSLPLRLAGPIHGGPVRLRVDQSSQFTSALLFVLPTVRPDSRLECEGRAVSQPYVRATLSVLHRVGVRVTETRGSYRIPGGQRYRARSLEVPGDASSAAYLWAAAAITGGRVTVTGVPDRWPQADLAILDLLEAYGAEVARSRDRVTVRGGPRRPFRVSLSDAPDLYPLAGVLAAAAPGRSRLGGASQVASKESDRRLETGRLARAMGAEVTGSRSGLTIEGTARPRPIVRRDISDHRVLMSAAVGALASDRPSELGEVAVVRKSFPEFFATLHGLGAGVSVR